MKLTNVDIHVVAFALARGEGEGAARVEVSIWSRGLLGELGNLSWVWKTYCFYVR